MGSFFTRAYAMLAICMGFLFYKYTLQLFPGVMTAHLMSLYHLNGAALGNLAASFFYGYVVMQWFAGPLVDRYGVEIPSLAALTVAVAGIIIFVNTTSLHYAQFARILMGGGAAFATITYLRCSALWFDQSSAGFTGGLLTVGVMCGAFLSTAPLSLLIRYAGVNAALLFVATLGLALIWVTWLYLREPQGTTHLRLKGISRTLWNLIKKKQNLLLTAYSGLAFAPLAVFGGLWGTPFLQATDHLSTTTAAGLVSLSYVGFGIGGPLFGYLSDRHAKRTGFMVTGLIISTLFLSAVVFVHFDSTIYLAMALLCFGMGTGSFMLGFTMGKEINETHLAGSVISMINTGDALMGAITEPLIGKWLDWGWKGKRFHGARVFSVNDYHHAFALLLGYLLLALVIVCFIHRNERERERGQPNQDSKDYQSNSPQVPHTTV